MSGWEKWDRDISHAHTHKAQVRFTSEGRVAFNAVAMKVLNDPEFVALYFDRGNKRVGIKPTDQDDKDAYKVTRGGGRNRSAAVSMRGFAKYWGLTPEKGTVLVYDAKYDGGMLVIELEESVESKRRDRFVGDFTAVGYQDPQ